MHEIEALLKKDYKDVLKNFVELTKIPHGSGNMKQIGDYIESRIKETNLAYVRDSSDNFIIRKAATKGYEALPVLSLQGHLDMVCEKNDESSHDFEKDPLPIRFDGEKLYCDGTTLGGDDGIAIAYCLSLIENDSFVHPELEFIFTTDEETGLYGAKALDGSSIKGKYLINLDSEDEGTALVACAGGATSVSRFSLQKEIFDGCVLEVSVNGLFGGHSGAEIDKKRENAIKVLSRVLDLWKNELKESELDSYRLVKFNGGTKDNAIPRTAIAMISINANQKEKALYLLKKISERVVESIRPYEKEIQIEYKLVNEKINETYTESETNKFIEYLNLAQTGVIMMDRDDPKMVETSCNLAIVREYEAGLEVHQSFRSSKEEQKLWFANLSKKLAEKYDGQCVIGRMYPAWEYKRESSLRPCFDEAHREFYGTPANFASIHAGLECGIFYEKKKELDMISIGPNMKDIHTPNESLNVESAIRFYKFIEKIIEKIALEK